MLRKVSVIVALTLGGVGMLGVAPASAVKLPAGNGNIGCDVAGSVAVARPKLRPDIARVAVKGAVSNCVLNGTPIPFVGGTSRTIVVANPAAACTLLANGGTFGRTVTRVTVGGTTVGAVTVNVTLAPPTPSGNGTDLELDGTLTTSTVTVHVHVSVVTDQPAGNLCNGTTSLLNFSGTAQADWSRA